MAIQTAAEIFDQHLSVVHKAEPPLMIYIMGRGHNGSTVLDGLLGNAMEIESVGELVSGLSRYPNELVATGEKMAESAYWQRVISRYAEKSGCVPAESFAWMAWCTHPRQFLTWLRAGSQHPAVLKALAIDTHLASAIAEVAGKPMVLDSTKEYSRGLFLCKFYPRSKIIHLIRSPIATVYSYQKRPKFKFLRRSFKMHSWRAPLAVCTVLCSWSVGCVLASIVRYLYPTRVLTIRYEDLCVQPRQELEKLGVFLGVDLSALAAKIEQQQPLTIGHNIGGNKMRFQRQFTFTPDHDKKPVKLAYRLLALLVNGPFLLLHRYSPFSP
jgi:hypothetical protein